MESMVIKPSDAKSWLHCKRQVWLSNKGDLQAESEADPFLELILQLGLDHERNVLRRLSDQQLGQHGVKSAKSVDETLKLMDQRVPIIYQAQLSNEAEGLVGRPDFLVLDDDGLYQAADAKLSTNKDKKEIQIQLGLYRRLLGNGKSAIVFLGDGSAASLGDEVDAMTEKYVADMRVLLSSDEQPSVKYSHSKCSGCSFYTHCKSGFDATEDLSLLYGVDGRSSGALGEHGINTISQLASADPETIPDVPYLKSSGKKARAVLQAKSHLTGEVFEMHPVELPQGDWVHFDIENNPLVSGGENHVYLWGFLVPDAGMDNGQFEYVWTDTFEDDEQGWHRFLEQVETYKARYPNLILAHYSNHELTTIKAYAQKYNMMGHATVRYLLDEGGPLFDIKKPVADSLVLPLLGYSLKDICKHPGLVNFQWEDEGSGSQWSVYQFNRFLSETNLEKKEALKHAILSYNRDDVTATHRLQRWLIEEFINN